LLAERQRHSSANGDDERVVAPERRAVADPPRLPHRVGAHAVSHAELEYAGEEARAWHADDEALQDTEPRVRRIMRTSRTIFSPDIRLSASSGSISSN
jgi:hypothetical protein